MRIVAGRHRGRKLMAPPGLDTRPTSDRAREALFNILEHGEPPLEGCRFLDLFAGSGAVGLEAASRGAGRVLLVEKARAAQAAARANIAHLGEAERVTLRAGDATRLGRAAEPFDIVFLDPPYGSGLVATALAGLARGGWLAPRGPPRGRARRGGAPAGPAGLQRRGRRAATAPPASSFSGRPAQPTTSRRATGAKLRR